MLCLFDLREQCQDALQEDRPTQKSSQLRAAAMSDLKHNWEHCKMLKKEVYIIQSGGMMATS